MTWRRERAGLAGSALGAALLLAWPLPVPGFVRLPAAFWLLGLLPGVLLAGALPGAGWRTLHDLAADALPAAIASGMLLAVPAVWRPLPAPLLASGLGLVCAMAAMLSPASGARRPPLEPAPWLAGLGIASFVALPLLASPGIRVYGDAMLHGQIVHEILVHGLPPRDPSFFDQPLAYAWPWHAWIAGLSRLSGLSPYDVFPAAAFVVVAALSLVLWRLAEASEVRGGAALVALIVILCAMNALGLFQAALRLGLGPYVGHERGGPSLARTLAEVIHQPEVGRYAAMLVFHGHRVLSSFLYKFLCVNAVAVSLMFSTAAYVSALLQRREGSGARAAFTAGLTAAALFAHPVAGTAAALATAVGLACALAMPGPRDRRLSPLLSIVVGGLVAVPALLVMLEEPIQRGAPTHLHPYAANAFALAQALLVSAPLALAGLHRAWRQDPGAVVTAAGYTAAASALSLLVESPSDTYAYPVYVAYLGSAWLLPHALAAVHDAIVGSRALRWTVRLAMAMLPLTTISLALVFLRHDRSWGFSGFPETPDERAVFDRLRETPVDAVVVDTQNFQMSAAAAYSARRSVFGGMAQTRLMGYPEAEMRGRERAIRELMFEETTSDSTWALLDRLGPLLYVVARRSPSCGTVFDALEQPGGDPIAKLDRLPDRLEPVLRTPTVALYRYRNTRRTRAAHGFPALRPPVSGTGAPGAR